MPLKVSASIAWGLGLLISFTPCQRDRYIGNINRHGRLRLVHGDLDALDGLIAQARQGNSVGKGLYQIERVPFNICSDRLRERTVVDGLGKIISTRGWREIQSAADVDDESLTLVALEAEHAMAAKGGYSSQSDPIAAALGGSALGVYDCVCRHTTS
jgi:hypothetical protein